MSLSYLSFVSLFLIPFQMILLALLSIGVARKQIHFVVDKVINFHLNVNGMELKFFPSFAVMSSISMAYGYLAIVSLQEQGHHSESNDQGEYNRILYMNYRNLLIHLSNVILVFQVSVVAKKYHIYMATKKELADIKKAK